MLKISILDTPRHRRVVIEGKLIAPWASYAGHRYIRSESVEIRYANADGESEYFGLCPLDRKGNWRCTHDTEIVGVMGVFPNVFAIQDAHLGVFSATTKTS